jgi:RloB-like protein
VAKAARFRQSNLRRRRPFIEQRAVFLLICEGRNSEPLYFSALGKRLKTTVIESIKAAGSPDAIASKAIEEARNRGLYRRGGRKQAAAKGDEIWAVFDRDQHEHFDAAVTKCEQNGLIESVHIAEERATRQLAARELEGNPFGPPSTTVHYLTEALRIRG